MVAVVPTPRNIKRTVMLVCAGVLGVLLVLTVLGLGGYVWWLQHQASKVPELRAAAQTAQANAESANAGATNATATRAAMDTAGIDIRLHTDDSARRIEDHEQADDAGRADAEPDPDVLRELADAQARARAAANRLQRKKPR